MGAGGKGINKKFIYMYFEGGVINKNKNNDKGRAGEGGGAGGGDKKNKK